MTNLGEYIVKNREVIGNSREQKYQILLLNKYISLKNKQISV